MEAGYEPKMMSGHTLTMLHDRLPTEPGFVMKTQVSGGNYVDVVMNIGSDDSWIFLIRHANMLSDQDAEQIMKQFKVSF
jgi:hypothetical protein